MVLFEGKSFIFVRWQQSDDSRTRFLQRSHPVILFQRWSTETGRDTNPRRQGSSTIGRPRFSRNRKHQQRLLFLLLFSPDSISFSSMNGFVSTSVRFCFPESCRSGADRTFLSKRRGSFATEAAVGRAWLEAEHAASEDWRRSEWRERTVYRGRERGERGESESEGEGESGQPHQSYFLFSRSAGSPTFLNVASAQVGVA